jgi:hypothetical protein
MMARAAYFNRWDGIGGIRWVTYLFTHPQFSDDRHNVYRAMGLAPLTVHSKYLKLLG